MRVQHRIQLSNGRVLLIEEAANSLHIATETEGFPGDVDMYIAEINGAGVLVHTTCGDAPYEITEGLKNKPST